VVDVTAAFRTALRQTERSIAEQYETGVRSAHSAALHAKVLLACALTVSSRTDGQGYFQPVQVGARLAPLLGRAAAGVSVYNKHLLEFCEEKRGRVLERQGRARSYRYRFRDPLLLPYVLLRGLSEGVIGAEGLEWAGGGDRG
jgi:predicted LPLAT superfamily acyltransferase